jgi:hypothetical protein
MDSTPKMSRPPDALWAFARGAAAKAAVAAIDKTRVRIVISIA